MDFFEGRGSRKKAIPLNERNGGVRKNGTDRRRTFPLVGFSGRPRPSLARCLHSGIPPTYLATYLLNDRGENVAIRVAGASIALGKVVLSMHGLLRQRLRSRAFIGY